MNLMFSPKDPDEAKPYGLDFSKVLEPDEVIESCVFSALDQTNGAAADDMIDGEADISEKPLVKQQIKGGAHKHNYLIKATVTTAAGNKHVGSATLPVRIGA